MTFFKSLPPNDFVVGNLHKPSAALDKHRQAIPAIVAACNCTNPRVFGSALHGTDTFTSDLDLLVDSMENTTLLDLVRCDLSIGCSLGTYPENWGCETKPMTRSPE